MEDVSAPCGTCGLDMPEAAPDVPEICIYTRSDGIVEWHSCIDEGPKVECIEVNSSHCGIPLNPKTWNAISARLSGIAPEAYPLHSVAIPERSHGATAARTSHRTRRSYLRLVARKGDAA
jgi:hypothetical protein